MDELEEEIIKLIETRENTSYGGTFLAVRTEVIDAYFKSFSRLKKERLYHSRDHRGLKEFYELFSKVNSIIDNADLALCLTSKYEYIRERRKI